MRPQNDAVARSVKLSATTQRVIFYGSIVGSLVAGYFYATTMPGRSHRGELPPASPLMQSTAGELKGQVVELSAVIGERRIGEGDSLARARDYLVSELEKSTAAGKGVLGLEQLDSNGDPNYHQSSDVSSNLSYGHMARVTLGLRNVIASLAGR